MLTSLLLGLAAMGAQAGLHGFIMPPKAVREGAIREVQLSPIFAEDFTCSQHFAGQIPYAGDDLGSDCMITGGVEGKLGYSRFFRTDGRTNADWYGWNAPVLSPTDEIVAGIVDKGGVNVPGTMGRPPANMLQLRRSDGIIVVIAHVTAIRVKLGEKVRAGEVLAMVGNNGMARSPHIHVGAWREATAEPLQIRWDLDAAARLQSR